MPADRGVAPLANVPDRQRRDGFPQPVIRGKHPVVASQENQALDAVELGTGKRFVRPLLKGVVVRDGSVVSLRLQPEGEARPTTVLLKAITKIVADRETVFEAEAKGGRCGPASRPAGPLGVREAGGGEPAAGLRRVG